MQKIYFCQGIAGLKLKSKGSQSYLTEEQKKEIIECLDCPEKRNISELQRYIMEKYDLVFRSKESYYQIIRSAYTKCATQERYLTWQKGNK